MRYCTIRHHSHRRHDLELKYSTDPIICDGCREVGFGLRFACDQCNHHLHQVCARPPETIRCSVYLTPVNFYFCGEPPRQRTLCNACRSDIAGYFYRDADGRLSLHPVCAELKPVILYGNIKMRLKVQMLAECSWCMTEDDGEVSTWSYVSEDRYIHVACVKEMLMASWEREHFIRHPTTMGGGPTPPLAASNNRQQTRSTASTACVTPPLPLPPPPSPPPPPPSSSSSSHREIVLPRQSCSRRRAPVASRTAPSSYTISTIDRRAVQNWMWGKVKEFLRELPWAIVRSLFGDPTAILADYFASVMKRWAPELPLLRAPEFGDD